ncbi:hypothetical protein CN186_28875 [Sinorhizobium medicae]|uniref:hypothetical protein n=1 Tax=Sinorhizobium medicae TaxID=110321 RepID=UPI000FDBC76A|nr:hypothetical protein [Sinorhizobium medicae]RVI88144.1 hypothetical protein CN186_28875 [Sinorhizobium medicae]
MGKQVAKIGFFEPGLVTAANFARFEPYQRTEFCLLAAEAGIALPDVAEMMRVPAAAVRTAIVLTFSHNPFKGAPQAEDEASVENRSTLARKYRIALLGHIEAGDDKTVTVTYANLSRAIGMRQKAMLSILQKMREGGYVDLLREGRTNVPAVLRLTLKGKAALTRWREAA